MNVTSTLNIIDRKTSIVVCGYCAVHHNYALSLLNAEDDTSNASDLEYFYRGYAAHENFCDLPTDLEDGTVTYEDLASIYPDFYADDTLMLDETFIEAGTEVSSDDQWAGIYANRDNYQRLCFDSPNTGTTKRHTFGNFSYRDVERTRCTHAIHWSYRNAQGHKTSGTYGTHHMPRRMKVKGQRSLVSFTETPTYAQVSEGLDFEDPRLMELEFTELQGFINSRMYDAGLTEKASYHYFNIFVGDYGDRNLHVGSCTIGRTIDDRVNAKCSKCKAELIAPPFNTITRAQMEDFIVAVIRHGNNHGPAWLTKRGDFVFIHADTCDTLHDAASACNRNKPRPDQFRDIEDLDSDEAIDFLIRHRKFCPTAKGRTASNDKDCRCTHYYHMLNEVHYVH